MTTRTRHLRNAATVCFAALPTPGQSLTCELLNGHDGKHKSGPTRWATGTVKGTQDPPPTPAPTTPEVIPPARRKFMMAAIRQRRERELSPVPVPSRITTALDLRALYGPEVDRACGVEEPAVDQWESGELVPTREQVEALARLTGYPVEFFYRPAEPPSGVGFICSTDDGCEVIDHRPDAVTLPMTGRGRLL